MYSIKIYNIWLSIREKILPGIRWTLHIILIGFVDGNFIPYIPPFPLKKPMLRFCIAFFFNERILRPLLRIYVLFGKFFFCCCCCVTTYLIYLGKSLLCKIFCFVLSVFFYLNTYVYTLIKIKVRVLCTTGTKAQ